MMETVACKLPPRGAAVITVPVNTAGENIFENASRAEKNFIFFHFRNKTFSC
jgi:hypothetical protein